VPAEDPRVTADAEAVARVEILALVPLPEIRPGDDLEALIGDALAATPDALPLEPGDVLVVTQKIVSKAEGAIVDLRTISPRPEAVGARARSSATRCSSW